MQKFIIYCSEDNVDMVTSLRHGDVLNHVNLLHDDECCLGGGFYFIDDNRKLVILHGDSVDFGKPDFSRLKHLPKEFEKFRIIYKQWLTAPEEGEEIQDLSIEDIVFDLDK